MCVRSDKAQEQLSVPQENRGFTSVSPRRDMREKTLVWPCGEIRKPERRRFAVHPRAAADKHTPNDFCCSWSSINMSFSARAAFGRASHSSHPVYGLMSHDRITAARYTSCCHWARSPNIKHRQKTLSRKAGGGATEGWHQQLYRRQHCFRVRGEYLILYI